MDDPNTSLTSNFGQSSQELMNLLLTGQAVSNVFDNSMKLSDDLTCHGIQSRSAIGYLSILESLRYCEVGGYYKSPTFPIWIVGSTSHFSVLFGDEVRHIHTQRWRGDVSSCIVLITHYFVCCLSIPMQQCLVESKSDILLEKCRRAFQKVEGRNGKSSS
jgi:hypothetical protein